MATYYVRSLATGAANGSSFTDAYLTIGAALAVATNADLIWVANDHAETWAANVTWTLPATPGLRILAANTNTGTPTGVSVRQASVAVTTSSTLAVNRCGYIYGIQFNIGGSGTQPLIWWGGSNNQDHCQYWHDCGVNLPSTSGSSTLALGMGGTNTAHRTRIIVDGLLFDHESYQSQGISLRKGIIRVRNMTLASGIILQTTRGLFDHNPSGGGGCHAIIEDSDFSNLASGQPVMGHTFTQDGDVLFRNIKVQSGYVLSTGTPGIGQRTRFQNCHTTDVPVEFGDFQYGGSIVDETTILRTGGGVVSARYDDTATTKFPDIAIGMEGSIYNDDVGSPLTLTVPFVHDSATALQDDEIWLEVTHIGVSGSPQGVLDVSDRLATPAGTPSNQTTDSSSTWTGHSFTNENKQQLSCTFTPEEAGYVHYRVCMAGGATKTVYVDILGATLA